MGPSGAGKTTLLNLLSQRNSTKGGVFASGTVFVNRRLMQKGEMGKIAAFVQQDDVLAFSLSPRELFTFACKIRLALDEKQI